MQSAVCGCQALARVADAAGGRVPLGVQQRRAGRGQEERPSRNKSTLLLRSDRDAMTLYMACREILIDSVSHVASGPEQVPLLPVKCDFTA